MHYFEQSNQYYRTLNLFLLLTPHFLCLPPGMTISNGAAQTEVQRLLDTAWKAIGTATVDGAVRERYWRAWERHCKLFPLNERGQNLPPHNIEDMLLTFAVAMREGQYGLRGQIQVQSVEVTLQAVAQKYVLDGHCDPRSASPAQHSLNLPIARDEDPPPKPKLAIPVSTIWAIITKCTFSPHHAAVADLVIVAFFYLLRVGEYTASRRRQPKQTIPL
jgi:hypothetical protein